jgi:hypothetical protein
LGNKAFLKLLRFFKKLKKIKSKMNSKIRSANAPGMQKKTREETNFHHVIEHKKMADLKYLFVLKL